jgi:uncharacterized protein (DUF1501 family)
MATMTRRSFLKMSATATALASAYATLPTWMPRLAFAQPYNNPKGDILISIFLRGGADALNMVVPYAEDAYYQHRPQLAIPRPDANSDLKVLDLDGFFGIHPSLAPLMPIFKVGQLAVVHAVGMPHDNRSHFEAMDFMERGTYNDYNVTNGWIGRHLATLSTENISPVRGVGWGAAIPTAMLGAPSSIAMQSIVDYHLGGDKQLAQVMMQSLSRLYSLESDSLMLTANDTQSAIEVIGKVGYEGYVPFNGTTYPENEFALALRQTAALIRADVGLEVSAIDLGGWDTHANQGGTEGAQANLMQELAEGLVAFHQDMGADMGRVTVVIMSEFGRTLSENGSRGTDHGNGGAMWVMSGNLAHSQPVIVQWPTLVPETLVGGDLAITIDYRSVLSEMLSKRLKNPLTGDIFSNFTATDLGIFRT